MQAAKLKSSFYNQTQHTIFLSHIFDKMNSVPSILAVDAGNTATKAAVFQANELHLMQRFEKDDLAGLKCFALENNCQTLVLSSVREEDFNRKLKQELNFSENFILEAPYKLPFPLHYANEQSLGKDRLCNVAAAFSLMKNDSALVIDIGTCLKADLIHSEKGYLGGSIAPGIQLRYNSLNDYTDKLPRLTASSSIQRTGKSTEESIHSGVLFGMQCEITELIRNYELEFPGLTIFMTGGDRSNFDLVAKNDIFAHENLTLLGLYQLYIYQK